MEKLGKPHNYFFSFLFVVSIFQKFGYFENVFNHQERRLELSKLRPISENAWLKRSNSDSSLSQVGSFFFAVKYSEILELLQLC